MAIKVRDFREAFAEKGKVGGGTRARADTTFRALEKVSRARGWGDVTPENLSSKQFLQYVQDRREAGISERVLANEASHIRGALLGAGQGSKVGYEHKKLTGKDPEGKGTNFTNARLGIQKASRVGGKAPADLEKYKAADLNDGARAVLDLSIHTGVRLQEGVKCTNIHEWASALQKASALGRAADLRMSQNSGSKGGRPRWVTIHAENVPKAIEAVQTVIRIIGENEAAGKGAWLIPTKDPAKNLEAAVRSVSNACTRAGLIGNDSPHGFRRAFACNQYDGYRAQGLTREEAISRLSADLGHGDRPGRWVENNYLGGHR